MTTYRSTKDIAADVRSTLKAELPEWKFSVRTDNYTGGSSIDVSLMSGPEQVIESYARPEDKHLPVPGYAQLNHYAFLNQMGAWADMQERRISNGYVLTPKGWDVMERATKILAAHHWDKSDISTDYFHCNFYMHIQVGQWNKPFTVKQ